MDQHCRRHHAFIVLLPLLLHSPFLLLPSSLSSASLLYVPHSIVALSSFSPHLFISPLLQYIPSLLFSFSFMSLPSSYLSPLLHTSSILLSTPLLSIIYLPPTVSVHAISSFMYSSFHLTPLHHHLLLVSAPSSVETSKFWEQQQGQNLHLDISVSCSSGGGDGWRVAGAAALP